jgi:hypothetical protein
MRAEQLLTVASLLCGSHAREVVFEPLIADWQREWRAAHGGLSSLRVIGRGAVAYTTSLLLSIDTREAVQRHATTIGWAALPAFTVMGGGIYVVLILWAFVNESPESNLSLGTILFWNVPALLSFGIVFALLPTCLALAWDHARTRRLLVAGVLAVVASIAIDGWLVPYISEQRARQRFGERAVSYDQYRGLTVVDYIRQIRHPDPQIAANARGMLTSLSMKVALMGALGIIGGVVGRSRSIARKPIGVRTIAGYWLFGWAATNALHFFVNYFGYYLALRPYRVTLWLPQLTLLIVGLVAWVMLLRTAPPLDSAAPGPRH